MNRFAKEKKTATCAAPGCGARISIKQFACTKHWHGLPKDMQRRMWSAARAVWADRGSKTRLRELYKIHDEAMEFWTSNEKEGSAA